MLSLSLSFALLLSTSISTNVLAAPNPPPIIPRQTVSMTRRTHAARSAEDWELWAKAQGDIVKSKYNAHSDNPQKRASGTNLLTNQNADSSYFGSLAIGTPPISFNMILDTGSADLWVADDECVTGCLSVPTFNPAGSSSFKNTSSPFQITYGSGRAAGTLGQDKIQMAGFSVDNQIFAVCDRVSSGLLNNPVSGLFGLGWATIAASGATPLWETLAAGGAWDQPLMSFQLTRFQNDNNAGALEPGGTFTMGFTDTSLYTGSIDYQPLVGTPSYWLLPLTSLTVQGTSIPLPTGTASYSAIDTGTTLVGGPPAIISQIFAQIPGSQPGTGNLQGYYTYPCATTVQVSLSFGGKTWPIDPADFRLASLSQSQCVGALFELTTGASAPDWIIGDTFLKNVYSVFMYSPPSVGFAQLSSSATAMNGRNGRVPTPTIGSAAAGVSATGGYYNAGRKTIGDVSLAHGLAGAVALVGAALI